VKSKSLHEGIPRAKKFKKIESWLASSLSRTDATSLLHGNAHKRPFFRGGKGFNAFSTKEFSQDISLVSLNRPQQGDAQCNM
jgi:hypothetical protein